MNLLITVSWYFVQLYTYIIMVFANWFPKKEIEDERNKFPFTIIEKNGMFQVYYPSMEKSTVSFIDTQIEIDGFKHTVEVNPFMVVGNRILDRDFVRWIMSNDHGIEMEHGKDYKILIMDKNVDIVTLTDKDYIEITKDNYLKASLCD